MRAVGDQDVLVLAEATRRLDAGGLPANDRLYEHRDPVVRDRPAAPPPVARLAINLQTAAMTCVSPTAVRVRPITIRPRPAPSSTVSTAVHGERDHTSTLRRSASVLYPQSARRR